MQKGKGGFVKIVVLIVVVLIVLGFMGYDVRDIANLPKVRDNLATFWGWVVEAWNWIVATAQSLIPSK